MLTAFKPTLDAGTTPAPTTTPAGQALQNAYKNMNPATATPTATKPPVPDALKVAAAQAPKPITPSYSGPHINAIPQVAQKLGATYNYDAGTNTHTVNGNVVKPISVVNGTPHAPVQQIAQAAGIPNGSVQQNGNNTQIMPAVIKPQTSGSFTDVKPSAQTGQLNSYWQDVYNHNGLWMSPTNGETPDQFKQEVAQHYGVDPNQMHMQSNGHVWIPFNAISNWAYSQSTPQQQQQQTQQPSAPSIVDTPPQAPTLPQIPTFDTSSIQPFQWDANQEFQNQYNAQLPAFQQQLTSESQKINDQMNNRGLYNSGIAQNAVDQQAQALYGKLFDAIQKNSLADQKQAFTEYQTNITNHLNAYKDNVDALYKSGQLTNQQYADAINVWKQQVSYAQNMYNQAMAMQKALIPYTMGPTPYQQGQLDLNQLKTTLPYQMPTAYQQGQLDQNQQKLQAQIDQWANTDQLNLYKLMGVGPDGSPTLDAQKLTTTVQHDNQMFQVALANATTTQERAQITALDQQLQSAAGRINAYITAGKTPPQDALDNYNAAKNGLKDIVDNLALPISIQQTSPNPYQGTGGSPLPIPN